MFVSYGQIFVFLACVTIGCTSGIFLSFSQCLKRLITNRAVGVLLDITAFIAVTITYLFLSFSWGFPSVRAYMIVGVIVGLWGYMKSFHIILAKFTKKFYNIIIKKLTKGKGTKDDRSKSKKVDSGLNGRGSVAFIYSSNDNGLSNDYNSGQKKSYRIFARPNRKIRKIN